MQRISSPRADMLPAFSRRSSAVCFSRCYFILPGSRQRSRAKIGARKNPKLLFSSCEPRVISVARSKARSEASAAIYSPAGTSISNLTRSAKTRIPQLLGDLQQATLDSPDQQRRLLKLQADLTTKMNELADTIALRREKGFEAALAVVNSDARTYGDGSDPSRYHRHPGRCTCTARRAIECGGVLDQRVAGALWWEARSRQPRSSPAAFFWQGPTGGLPHPKECCKRLWKACVRASWRLIPVAA